MPRLLLALLLGLAVAGGLVGCDYANPNDVRQEIVVESYQVADQRLAPVRLTRAAPLAATFDPDAFAVRGADVRIDRLDANGDAVETVAYRERDDAPGVYVPQPAVPPRVAPLATYRLRVDAGGERLSALTLVPDTLSLVRAENTEGVYQSPDQPTFTVTPSRYPGRQAFYIFTIESLLDFEGLSEDELLAELTPFVRDVFDDEEDEVADLRIGSSPILNQSNYDTNPDGTVTIDVPWLAVAFYGPNRVRINALDDNLYDFIRSESVQQGGQNPGEIPNVLDRVDGGTGIFGSYATIAHDVEVLRPDATP
jgi:hypothetical protein